MGLARAGVGFNHGMPVIRNLFQNRWSAIGERGHGSAFLPVENRTDQPEAPLHKAFQLIDSWRFESACVTNRTIVRTTVRKFVVAHVADYIQQIALASSRNFLIHF